MNTKETAIQIYKAALESVHPSICIRKFLSLNDQQLKLGKQFYNINSFDNIYVVGAGKATAAMALATEDILGERIRNGIIAVKKDHGLPLRYIQQIEAGHPLPDEQSVHAATSLLHLLDGITKNDLLIILLSGGGTSLLADLPGNITLSELRHTYQLLQQCGVDIHESNTVRKHLSEIKGGGLAVKCNGATVACFIISDVIGNELSVIASGPTVADETTNKDALYILEKYSLMDKVPQSIIDYLRNEIIQNRKPLKGNPCFESISNWVIADNKLALLAAKQKAEALGYKAHIVSSAIKGEAKDVAAGWVRKAKKQTGNTCLIAGGETTVTIKGNGKGGRNQEFALAALRYFKNEKNITIFSAGSDGTDGPTNAAGAIVSSMVYENAVALGLNINAFLSDNDSYHFFEKAGGHLLTGPTQTNVMDIIIALID